MADDTKTMTLRIARAQAEALEAVAEVEERAVAEVIRDAIDQHIEARRRDARFQKRLRRRVERNRRILQRLARK